MSSIEEKKIPVMMTIRGEQRFDNMEPDSSELMTEGTMEVRQEMIVLSYQETELTGLEGTITSFEVYPRKVVLSRSGTVNSQMIFEEGRQHTSLYETPYGDLPVDIQTSRLRNTLTVNGGLLEIKYAISIANTVTGRNCFKIRVKRKM